MPRTPEANELIREERRAAILATAAHVFAQRGYVGTRISDIADAVGMSKGLIYHYFPSKGQVFAALVDQAARGVVALLQAALARPDAAGGKLRWLVEQEIAGLRDDADIFMVVLQAMMSDAVPREARRSAEALVAETAGLMRELVLEGQARGEVRAGDPDDLAAIVGTWLQGLAVGAAMRPVAGRLPPAASFADLFEGGGARR